MDLAAEKPANIAQGGDERFHRVMDELEKIRQQVVSVKNWFETNSVRPRILFRIVGSAIILLSVLVPFLATLDGLWKTIVLPVVAVAIAGLTGLNAFFQWQNQWHGNRRTQYALEHLLSKWDLEIVKAKFHANREKAIDIAIEATNELLDQASNTASATTADFFKSVRLPTTK